MHIAWILRDNWSTFVGFSIVMVHNVNMQWWGWWRFLLSALKLLCNSLSHSCCCCFFFQVISKQAKHTWFISKKKKNVLKSKLLNFFFRNYFTNSHESANKTIFYLRKWWNCNRILNVGQHQSVSNMAF